jgi:hypothetical protein
MFVYLTLDGTEPINNNEWATFSYEEILEILDGLELNKVSNKVISFIEDYKSIIRRHLLTDINLEEICRRIYFKHKKALDLIYEYKPDIISEINSKIKSLIFEIDDYNERHSIKSSIRFSTEILDQINNQYREVSSGWVKDNSILLHEIKITDKNIKIVTIVGPSDGNERDKVINHYNNYNQSKKSPTSIKYTTIKSTKLIDYSEDDSIDFIFNKIEELLLDKIQKHCATVDEIMKAYNY